jgi:hypothetical protein
LPPKIDGTTMSAATTLSYGSGNNPVTSNPSSDGTLTFTSAAIAAFHRDRGLGPCGEHH